MALRGRCAVAWELHIKGKTGPEIAEAMGVTRVCANNLITYARKVQMIPSKRKPGGAEKPPSFDWEKRTTRCKCGLLLPCYSCIPTIYQVASGRVDTGVESE